MSSSPSPPPQRCLFSAPFSFIAGIEEAYRRVLPTVFREIWRRREVEEDESITIWVVNPGQSFVVDRSVLGRLPSLRLVVTPSTGLNHIDRDACGEAGVAVRSLLDDRQALEAISASAEFTFLLMLNALRRLELATGEVTARRWRQREDLLRGLELQGKRVGLVGLGRIGRRLARYCEAFGADVLYFDPYVTADQPARAESLETLFGASDIVCVCCALTEETRALIDGHLLRELKPNACLVNTSRGEVIDMAALDALLDERDDVRVALDVLPGEVQGTHLDQSILELHDRGRVVVTPHVAGATVESQAKAAMIALDQVRRFCAGPELARDG
jgi:phosphoglycerate dehydrogenase-like enzyme